MATKLRRLVPTFADFAMLWLRRHRHAVTADTAMRYELAVRLHLIPHLGARSLASITGANVRNLGRLLIASHQPGTVRNVLRLLAYILEEATRDGLLDRNVAVGAARPYQAGKGRPLSVGDRRALAAVLERRTDTPAAMILYLLRTGLRISEALGGRWSDFDPDGGTLLVERQWTQAGFVPHTKTKRPRVIDLTPKTVDLLRTRRQESSWLWPGRTLQKPTSHQTVAGWWHRAMRQARIGGYRVHDLRHTYATVLIEAGTDLRYVQQQMGHATLAITVDLYGRFARRPRATQLDVLDHLDAPTLRPLSRRDSQPAATSPERRERA